MLLLISVGFLYLAIPVVKSEDAITIDNLQYNDLIWGEDISKEDLKDHVVGIKFWGKW